MQTLRNVTIAGGALVMAANFSGCASAPGRHSATSTALSYGAMRTEIAAIQPSDLVHQKARSAPEPTSSASSPAPSPAPIYGDTGTTWWSLQSGAAFTPNNTDINARLSLHRFVAQDFEVNGSLGVWGHYQDDSDEASGAFDFGARWHFVNRGRNYDDGSGMTVYAEMGIGMLFATGEVPDGGTSYDFTPRAGFGATWPIGDGQMRLDAGVRWQHFSNGSSAGSDDNPSRDAAMVYVGVIFPF